MDTKQTTLTNSRRTLLALLLGLVSLAGCYALVVRPLFFLLVTDLRETFHFTFSVTDLDLDGDLDVLVHNRRNEGEFVAFSGGALWINQGGLQGGQTGHFVYQLNDLEGGTDSTTADLDGDGDPDVLIYDGFRLVLGLNQGGEQGGQAGVFRKLSSISPSVEQDEKYNLVTQFGSVVAGDINTDGRIDALILGCCGRPITYDGGPDGASLPNVSWAWFNQTDANGLIGRNVASLDALEGLPVAEAALADLDGDKDLDLFAVILKSRSGPGPGPTSVVLLNDGSGRFSDSGQRLGGEGSSSVALGDLDGDGDLDALVGNSRGVAVWINQGGMQAGQAGRFTASGHDIAGSQTRSVLLADLDGDGDLDALVAGKRRAGLWWNDGQGRFTRGTQSIPCSDRQDLTIGDFNGDGRPDIFVGRYNQSSQVWFNDGEGGWRPADLEGG